MNKNYLALLIAIVSKNFISAEEALLRAGIHLRKENKGE